MTTESGSAPPRAVNPLSAIALAVVATLGVLYIVSQFLRNSVGVIAPNLAAEIGLSPIEIGLLSSIYFFVFAAAQLPLGVALDRFGPKLCMLVSIGFTVLGCVRVRAGARAPAAWSPAARCSASAPPRFLMAPVALYARWFPPERFSTFAGIQLGIGSLGAMLRDRAAGLRHRELRLARDLSRRRRLRRRDRRADLADRQRRSARREDRRRASETLARKRRRHLAGDPHAVDGPRLHDAARELSELRAGRRAVGRAVSHPHLRLRPDRAAATSCSSRRWRRWSARSSGARATGCSAATRCRS